MVDVGSVGGATSPLSLLRWVALSLFAHIVAVVILMQLYPRSLLNEFGGDDGHASRYLAGLSTATSVIEFAMVPRLSELSDEWGRKPLLRALLALQALICVVLSMSPENVWFITAAYLASSLPTAVFAISSAVIADVTRGGDVGTSVQSFGFVLGTFGLAMAVGPLAGGSLVSVSPRLAAIVAAVCPVLSLMILECGVWPETAPDALLPKKREERVGQHSDDSSGECKESDVQEPDAEGGGEQRSSARPGCCGRAYNLIMGIWALFRGPFDTAHLVFVASGLWQPACVFLLSSFAFGGIVVWYTLLDWRLNWNPLEMGAFFSAYGVSLALFQAIVVQCMVPRLLSEELAIVSGLFLQTAFFALFAMASSSTLVYLAVPIGALSSVSNPCLQALMAERVSPGEQGLLQGALASMRIFASGVSAPVYGYLFAYSIRDDVQRPGLTNYISATFSLVACILAALTLFAPSGRAELPLSCNNEEDALTAPLLFCNEPTSPAVSVASVDEVRKETAVSSSGVANL